MSCSSRGCRAEYSDISLLLCRAVDALQALVDPSAWSLAMSSVMLSLLLATVPILGPPEVVQDSVRNVPVSLDSHGSTIVGRFFAAGDPGARPTLLLLPGWPGNPDDVLGLGGRLSDISGDLYLVTAGPHETVDRLVERLRSREYPGLVVRHDVLRGEDHTSAGPAAISRMLHRVHFPR